jgi:hypothetical protein
MSKQLTDNPTFQVLRELGATGKRLNITDMRDALKSAGLVSGRDEQEELARTRTILLSYNRACQATDDPSDEYIRVRPQKGTR